MSVAKRKGCYGRRASAVAPLGRVTAFHGEGRGPANKNVDDDDNHDDYESEIFLLSFHAFYAEAAFFGCLGRQCRSTPKIHLCQEKHILISRQRGEEPAGKEPPSIKMSLSLLPVLPVLILYNSLYYGCSQTD